MTEIEMHNIFEQELAASAGFMKLLKDDDFARKFYCSLENQDWVKGDIVASYSFRATGGLIAHLRREGDYLDWYCCWMDTRYESCTVYREVEQALNLLGWYANETDKANNKRNIEEFRHDKA